MTMPEMQPPPDFPIANMVDMIRLALVGTAVVEVDDLGSCLHLRPGDRDYTYDVTIEGGWQSMRLVTAESTVRRVTPIELMALVGREITEAHIQPDRRLQLTFDDGCLLEVEGSGPLRSWVVSEHDATGAKHGELLSRCEVEGRLSYASEFRGVEEDFSFLDELDRQPRQQQ